MDLPPKFKHPCPTTKELQSLANSPSLAEWEACKLMQGLCPNRKVGNGEVTWLEECSPTRIKLNIDKKNGKMKFPISPINLVNWCALKGIHLPEGFSNEVISLIFHLKRPKNRVTDTNELIRGSTSDCLAKQYPEDKKRLGRPNKKTEVAVRGYESNICKHARHFCLNFIEKKGNMPLKKTITDYLSSKLNRTEADIDRAYSLEKIITPDKINKLRQKYRRNLRYFRKDARK